jgi:hypothetical protein
VWRRGWRAGTEPGPGAKAGYKLGVSAKFERSTSPCSIDGTGTPSVTLSTTASIPMGSSILLNHDSYKGVDASATYHHITAELGYKGGRRVSSGVQRIDADHVRVTVGDSDFVENILGLKVGTDDAALGVSFGNGFAERQGALVRHRRRHEAGWDADRRFIAHGDLPAQGAAGTSNPTTSTSATDTSNSSITAKLGPIGGTKGGTTIQDQIVETTRPDGSKSTTALVRRGDTVIATTYSDADLGNLQNQAIDQMLGIPLDSGGDPLVGTVQSRPKGC